MLLQLAVIILLSLAASYAFQQTKTPYQINGICIYRYIAYAVTIFLGYFCFSHYKRYIGLAFSCALLVLAFSPISQRAIELFPLVVPFLGVLMGVTTVLAIPKARGREFIGFLAMLVLPAILAMSQIESSFRLLATTEEVGHYALSAIPVIIVGGCIYLRYAAWTNLSHLEFSSNGGSEEDVAEVSKVCNLVIIAVALGGSGIAACLTAATLLVAEAFRATAVLSPLYVLVLALGVGVVIVTTFYLFQLPHRKSYAYAQT